jgi:PAS domain S-box-containing protein
MSATVSSNFDSLLFSQETAQEQLFAILESIGDGFLALDGEWRCIIVNATAERLIGTKREEISGRNFWEVFPPTLGTLLEKEYRRAAAGETCDFENFYEPLGRWFHNRCFPRQSGGIVVCFQDITERKQTEISLQELNANLERIVLERAADICASEEKYRSLVESTSDCIWEINPNGRFTYLSPNFLRHTGYTPEEFIGRTPADFLLEEKRQKISEEFFDIVAAQNPFCSLEHPVQHRDGILRTVEISGIPVFGREGDYLGMRGITRDITKRKQVEEQLLASEHFLRMVTDNIPGMVGYWTRDLICCFASRAYREWFGKAPEQIVGTSIQDLMGEEEFCKREHYIHGALNGETQKFEMTLLKPNGENGHIWLQYVPDIIDGMVKGFYVLASDITDIKKTEDEKAMLENQLRHTQKMESIGRLAGGVAHDFNNMLAVIVGFAELSMHYINNTEKLKNYLGSILKAAQSSINLTRKLLTFSRQDIISPKPIDINRHLFEAEINLLRLIGEDIRLTLETAEDIWIVYLDPSQLDQILINLAVNSRDAMHNGGSLHIETKNVRMNGLDCLHHLNARPGEYVRLSIADSGTGIDKYNLEHIFEPFFTTKEIGKGTGLGLSTVYGIVAQNKGFIGVQSKIGEGTTFFIYFPRYMGEAGTESTSKLSALDGSGTILLVEDEEMVRNMTDEILRRMGYSLIVAKTPQEAITICENSENNIDLILTDVVMPGMNGLQMVERINEIRPGIRVLYMTGYTADMLTERGLVEGEMNILRKPFKMDLLNEKIKEMLAN